MEQPHYDIPKATEEFRERIRSEMRAAAKRYQVTIDADSMVIGSAEIGLLATAPIKKMGASSALIFFSFPQTACGRETLPTGFYIVEAYRDAATGTGGLAHLDPSTGREIVRIPQHHTLSHKAAAAVDIRAPASPTSAVVVGLWSNTGDDSTHVEYDLTNRT